MYLSLYIYSMSTLGNNSIIFVKNNKYSKFKFLKMSIDINHDSTTDPTHITESNDDSQSETEIDLSTIVKADRLVASAISKEPTFGQLIELPNSRIKQIMKCDPEINNIAYEAAILINKSTVSHNHYINYLPILIHISYTIKNTYIF